MAAWGVVVEPSEDDPVGSGKKTETRAGLAVVLKDTEGEEERVVARVSYARQDSRNPDVSFEDQLRQEVETAEAACEEMNAALDEFERRQHEELMKAGDRIAALLGPSVRGKLA